jgi:hypothetical protein
MKNKKLKERDRGKIMEKIKGGLFGNERVSDKPGNYVDKKIGDRTVARVFDLANVFEEIVYAFDDGSFAEK